MWWYYMLMIPSIVISSFLAVLGFLMPTSTPEENERYKTTAACLNAFNTIILGVLALLKYQSKAESHIQAASSCMSLKCECDDIEIALKTLVTGIQNDDMAKEKEFFMRTFINKLAHIGSKLEEITDMNPLSQTFVMRGRQLVIKLKRQEMKLEQARREYREAVYGPPPAPQTLPAWPQPAAYTIEVGKVLQEKGDSEPLSIEAGKVPPPPPRSSFAKSSSARSSVASASTAADASDAP
jgi:hypothetical protein